MGLRVGFLLIRIVGLLVGCFVFLEGARDEGGFVGAYEGAGQVGAIVVGAIVGGGQVGD